MVNLLNQATKSNGYPAWQGITTNLIVLGKVNGSDPAALGQADPLRLGYDKVIEYPNVDQAQCFSQASGDGAVCLGRLGTAGRVVVRKDQGRGAGRPGSLHHHRWTHAD